MTRSDKMLCLLYAVIAAAALIVTQVNNAAFFLLPNNGGLPGYLQALYANPASASFVNDVTLYVVAGFIFMIVEGRRLKLRYVWVYLVLSALVAVSVMFPLFLIARQFALARQRTLPPPHA